VASKACHKSFSTWFARQIWERKCGICVIKGSEFFMSSVHNRELKYAFACLCSPSPGDLSSNDGFVDMPETSGPQTPSQHGTYVGNTSPYPMGHESGGSMHHFPHFTSDGIPVYPPLGE